MLRHTLVRDKYVSLKGRICRKYQHESALSIHNTRLQFTCVCGWGCAGLGFVGLDWPKLAWAGVWRGGPCHVLEHEKLLWHSWACKFKYVEKTKSLPCPVKEDRHEANSACKGSKVREKSQFFLTPHTVLAMLNAFQMYRPICCRWATTMSGTSNRKADASRRSMVQNGLPPCVSRSYFSQVTCCMGDCFGGAITS